MSECTDYFAVPVESKEAIIKKLLRLKLNATFYDVLDNEGEQRSIYGLPDSMTIRWFIVSVGSTAYHYDNAIRGLRTEFSKVARVSLEEDYSQWRLGLYTPADAHEFCFNESAPTDTLSAAHQAFMAEFFSVPAEKLRSSLAGDNNVFFELVGLPLLHMLDQSGEEVTSTEGDVRLVSQQQYD